MAQRLQSARGPRSATLADILERVLETGIVIAGDIRVNLNDVELLTIQIRLVVCSVDKADQMGIDWWKSADYLQAHKTSPSLRQEHGAAEEADGSEADGSEEAVRVDQLHDRMEQLEKSISQLANFVVNSNPNLPDQW